MASRYERLGIIGLADMGEARSGLAIDPGRDIDPPVGRPFAAERQNGNVNPECLRLHRRRGQHRRGAADLSPEPRMGPAVGLKNSGRGPS